MSCKINSLFSVIFIFIVMAVSTVEAKEWQSMKSRHFIISFRGEVPEDFVNSVLDSAEDSYKEVIENLGVQISQSWNWADPVNIYIYRDQDDYVKNGGQAGWSHGAALLSSRTIRTFPADQGFFDSILPHELGHIILHEYVGLRADVPLWFDEGVAMYQEKARRIGANKIVKDALENGQFIALTELTDMRLYNNSDRKLIDLFYAESASIVNFMINELGKSRFYRFCAELRELTPFDVSLDKMYMHISNTDELNNKWVKFLKDQS